MNLDRSWAASITLLAALAVGGISASTASARDAHAHFQAGGDAAQAIRTLLAESIRDERGRPLLPRGTQLDRANWTDHVLEIDLTLPIEHNDWRLSTIRIETLAASLAAPFASDDAFGGTRIRARIGPNDKYKTLERFLPPHVAAPPRTRVEITPPSASASDAREARRRATSATGGERYVRPAAPPNAGTGLGGPTSNADRQPIGALTGVTVFASCGHGWTADNVGDGGGTDFKWFLQRPLEQGMIEDYGNLDMLNQFVHFAFNAGATVVPMRPVGWQPIEVVLDQDDPGVTFTGTWSDSGGSKYYENGVTASGVPYRFADASTTESATARYTPNITTSDIYPVYCFAAAGTNRTLQTYRVAHSGGVSAIAIDHREVGNGWIWLGNYYLEAGGNNYVEITNASPDAGVVIADAIRWGCGTGDITRPGPGTISGFPRDEEAQRYWANSELGNNAVGFDPGIWDRGGLYDVSDNVGAGGRTAREMNQVPAGGVLVDRWKRIHLEFHSNASGGIARGQICLITDLGATSFQTEYATTLADEVDADMLVLDSEFEHPWVDRASPTFLSSFGAIATSANSDEFDATIVELAFHDNPEDAELLRDSRVRAAMARSCVQGIIRFLNSLPTSQVPLAFPPDTPRKLRVTDAGNGDAIVSWDPPLSDSARGDPATAYVVYQSSNGRGFGDPVVLGNVTSTTISGIPAGQTRYFRVAATNAGGESMPSEVLAFRTATSGAPPLLVVNGFDRLRRQTNVIQTFTQPADYAGRSFERQIWRRSNSFDYVIQHAEALAANDIGFDSASNEAVADSTVPLSNYDIAVWILGTESSEDATFDLAEQARVRDFLENGGALFASGSEIAFDLISQSGGVSFAQDTLRVGFVADDAGTFDVTPAPGGILADVGAFDFDPAAGAPYGVRTPDVLSAGTDAVACVNYSGGAGGIAGLQFTGPIYNTVIFGFPFETITSAQTRADIMQRVIGFLETAAGPLPFDFDRDGDVDFRDFQVFAFCDLGPDNTYPDGHLCLDMDGDRDRDVDAADFTMFQLFFTGP